MESSAAATNAAAVEARDVLLLINLLDCILLPASKAPYAETPDDPPHAAASAAPTPAARTPPSNRNYTTDNGSDWPSRS